MKRDVVDHLGEKIGELELPDDTLAEVWETKLATYLAAPTALVPELVTARQLRLAILMSGMSLQTVADAIATLESPHREIAEVEWEYATTVERNNPLVDMVAAANGLSSEQIDSFFGLAATL